MERAALWILAVVALASCVPRALAQDFNRDVTNLLTAKPTLSNGDNPFLQTWNATSSICSWRGTVWAYTNGTLLDCDSPEVRANQSLARDADVVVTELNLGATGLTGSIPKEFGLLGALSVLWLRENVLTGAIPLEIGNAASLSVLALDRNRLSSNIPPSLWNLCPRLTLLALDSNALDGEIPNPANPGTQCPVLTDLRLQNNQLSGPIPAFLGDFAALTTVDLSNNSFSGAIPTELGQLANLRSFSVAYNNLSGSVPSFGTAFDAGAFAGNPALCGAPLAAACNGSTAGGGGGAGATARASGGLSPKVVAGIIIGVLAFFVVAGSLLIFLTQARARMPNEKQQVGVDFKREFEEEEAGGEAGKIVHFEGGEALTAEDVLNATGEVLGKTSYGTVYKAKLSHGHTIALRLLREGTARDRAEFVPAIQELGLIRHRNLVPLRAYYSGPKEEKLLVYDYMPRGSLADLLHNGSSGKPGASWARRHKIVLGAARGLAHLHTGLSTPVIHGNLKSKNILVDDNYVAHLSDYGLEKLMIPAATNDVITAASTQGYKAPELIKLKRANTKTDIYSFGIVLLEVLTGKRPGKSPESDEVVDLPTMVKAAVLEEKTTDLFDFDLVRGTVRTPSEDGLLQALQLAMGCCAPTPVVRPDIAEVIRQLEEIRPKVLSSVQSPLYTPDSTSTRSREAFDY
ncbi:hypothetical protein MPTK1_7g06240 [Marchantia polymorpha subsp. ruderalis]|uniref:Protein kinase domain-containing protein n=2 Tax=Marchantia polymorpha TaxID=3197 RepID=A0AAF6BWP8_MARPO|nr:hypothetical protein MARPO_0057s0047 [Marchantia polymorpha]BBN16432.1 hypothetical protein Mp_7g06240 [Marchantia polymorpha subsp. ruderalis]|eukprot:PTQ37410.1 hypothetical protein MARPO_0057s0047 [Marchantia polymorpha]